MPLLPTQGMLMDVVFRIFLWAGLAIMALASVADSLPGTVAGIGLLLAGAVHEASIKLAAAVRAKP